MQQEALLDQHIAQVEAIAQEVQAAFGSLADPQLNWKPNPDVWSIGQVLDHIITSNTLYFPVYDTLLKTGKPANGRPFRHTWMGGMVARSMLPGRNKFKNPKVMAPASSSLSGRIVYDFGQHQQRFAGYLAQAKAVDLRRNKLNSPAWKWVRLSLGDSFQLLVNHEIRHLAQAKRVLNTEGFPAG